MGGLLPNRTGLLPGRAGLLPGRGGGTWIPNPGFEQGIAPDSYSDVPPHGTGIEDWTAINLATVDYYRVGAFMGFSSDVGTANPTPNGSSFIGLLQLAAYPWHEYIIAPVTLLADITYRFRLWLGATNSGTLSFGGDFSGSVVFYGMHTAQLYYPVNGTIGGFASGDYEVLLSVSDDIDAGDWHDKGEMEFTPTQNCFGFAIGLDAPGDNAYVLVDIDC